MAKITIPNINADYASAASLNSAFDSIETAIENTLSRDGTAPNNMEVELDMSSNPINNLGAPQNSTSAARLQDVTGTGTINIGRTIYTSYAALRLADPTLEQNVLVTGGTVEGDGDGGEFYWDATSTATDDGLDVIKVTAVTTGRFLRLLAPSFGNVSIPTLQDKQTELIAGVLRQQIGVSITITAATTTATVTHTAHGYTTGRYVNVKGAVETDYNGYFQITVTGVDTYTYTMGGSPTSPATGTITGRSPEQWDWITTGNHTPVGVDSSTSVIVTSPYDLTIPLAKTYSEALSIVAGPDEELASRFGMSVGASVSLNEFTLKMGISRTLSAGISYNGSSWDVSYGFNQGGTEAGQVNITDATFSNPRLILTHDVMLGGNISVSPVHISGVTVTHHPVIESRTTTETRIRFIDASTGAYVTAADVDMSFQLSYNYNSDYPWDGVLGDADATEFEDGNIWFIGAMQV